jgi:hypothetical protein
MSHTRVEFKAFDGTVLRGDYYAVDELHAPIVIMTQGVSSWLTASILACF